MKKALAAAALAALSASAFAAGNPGTITFNGEIVAGACGISGDTLDQTVSLGQVPANTFAKLGDRSQATPFNIQLTDCDTTTAKNAGANQPPRAHQRCRTVTGLEAEGTRRE